MNAGLKRLNELTDLLTDMPDSMPPPIPKEWRRHTNGKTHAQDAIPSNEAPFRPEEP